MARVLIVGSDNGNKVSRAPLPDGGNGGGHRAKARPEGSHRIQLAHAPAGKPHSPEGGRKTTVPTMPGHEDGGRSGGSGIALELGRGLRGDGEDGDFERY